MEENIKALKHDSGIALARVTEEERSEAR